MSTLSRDAVYEALVVHPFLWARCECACGVALPGWAAHRQHVAAALMELARPEHEVKEEALREAAMFFREVDMPVAADLLENLADGWARPLRGETL